jgi:hypothetical protein
LATDENSRSAPARRCRRCLAQTIEGALATDESEFVPFEHRTLVLAGQKIARRDLAMNPAVLAPQA